MQKIYCLLKISNENSGGRSMPFGQGFSPQFQFDGDFVKFFGTLDLSDDEDVVFPGDQIKANVYLSNQNTSNYPSLYAGLSFNLFEGEQNIGEGTILKLF